MAVKLLSAAKAVLLAVRLASSSDVSTLRNLVIQQRKNLRLETVLRVILTYLPEDLDTSNYVPLLQDLIFESTEINADFPIDSSEVLNISEDEARLTTRTLRLLPLKWPSAPADIPEDPITLFLIQRSLRIDENVGLLAQVPELLEPFLGHSQYLRTWMISTILPLKRMNYEYHPGEGAFTSIPVFEALDDRAGVALLLSQTSQSKDRGMIGRDLRGLVGPWMYGDTRIKRRKLRKDSGFGALALPSPNESSYTNEKCAGWEETFAWITNQATQGSWKTCVQAIEEWDGPSDIDLGIYGNGTQWLDEDDQQYLERRYARSAMAAAYLMREPSLDALAGAHRILARIITLLDKDRIPTLEASGALLFPVTGIEDLLKSSNGRFLRNDLMEEHNVLTTPKESSLGFLQASLISAYLLVREGREVSVRTAAEFALFQDEHDQINEFSKLIANCSRLGPKTDDKYWLKIRNELLWLRSWGAEEFEEGADAGYGRGVFGKVPKDTMEAEFLKALLFNTRFNLAQSIYVKSPEPPLSKELLQETIIASAMNAFDNATNGNRTRGGVKKCDDILKAFPDTLKGSMQIKEAECLVDVAHNLAKYRLVFNQGEIFTPVILRVHGDPLSIISKVLAQNARSYTNIQDMINLGHRMVEAGLTVRKSTGETSITKERLREQKIIAEKRVISMCISAALGEDDFETAYSYVTARLSNVGGKAHSLVTDESCKGHGLYVERPPAMLDDWSWRAAFEAGKYRRNESTARPTHLGNASGNPEIRHLEQCKECLACALRFAPNDSLQTILGVFRRTEEELATQERLDAEQEEAWDDQGDNQVMPGGFGAPPQKSSSSHKEEEAPMSLFDLSKKAMAPGLSFLQGNGSRTTTRPASVSSLESPSRILTGGPEAAPIRKRDQIRNVAAGTLASGLGYLLGAQPVLRDEKKGIDDD